MNTNRIHWTTVLIALVLGWAYLPTFRDLYVKWEEPQYSHGFIVPLFSLLLLYFNCSKASENPRSWPLLGYLILAIALASRILAALLSFLPLDALSFVICLTGLAVLAGGKDMLRWTWQSLVFLLFMIPLPYQLERMMGAELQRFATFASTFILQTLGQPAIAEGNTILIDDIHLGVVEACSGLRMLVTFFALTVGAVMLMERHWSVKALVVVSAIPIALFTNILRITATGMTHVILRHSADKEPVLKFIHDFYGLLMPPIGLALLLLELWILKNLLVEPRKNVPATNTYS